MSSPGYVDSWQTTGDRKTASAVGRNKDAIVDVLQQMLPAQGRALEIASGTGEHVCYFAERFPHWQWQPSEPVEVLRKSISAWTAFHELSSVAPPKALDLSVGNWWEVIDDEFDFIFNANMVHISPWQVSQRLFAGATTLLRQGGQLCLYGPFFEQDVDAAESNHRFDASLKERDPDWGIRSRENLEIEAERHGLVLRTRIEMPSNNLMLWFGRTKDD